MSVTKGAIGATAGAAFAVGLAYLLAIALGAGSPFFVLVVPGLIVGWLAGRRWGTTRPCPACASEIPRDANVCRYCQTTLR